MRNSIVRSLLQNTEFKEYKIYRFKNQGNDNFCFKISNLDFKYIVKFPKFKMNLK